MLDERFKIGELIFSIYRKTLGIVYDYAYDASPERRILYGILWPDGSRSWETFTSIRTNSII